MITHQTRVMTATADRPSTPAPPPMTLTTRARPGITGVSIILQGGRTTVRLESAFDLALDRAAQAEGVSRSECARRAVAAHPQLGVAAAIRVWLLEWALAQAGGAR